MNPYRAFTRLPLRISLPLLLLLMFSIILLISLLLTLHQAHRSLVEEASYHALNEAAHFARRAENELVNDAHDVQRMVMLHAAEVEEFNAVMSALLDPQGRVIYSFRSEWAGRPMDEVWPGWDGARFRRVTRGVMGDLRLDDRQERLSVLMPFAFPRQADEIAATRRGAIYIEYDLRVPYLQMRHAEIVHHLPHLAGVLLGILLLAIWLRRYLHAPILQLSSQIQRVSQGEKMSKLDQAYPAELRVLSAQLMEMDQELRQKNHELLRERDRNQHYLDTVNAIVVVLDGAGNIEMINRRGCDLLGYGEQELLGRNWFSTCLPQPQGMEEVYPVFMQMMAGHLDVAEYFENAIQSRDGSLHMISWHNGYFTDEQGRITGIISSGEDVTARRHDEQLIHHLANYDGLTGLANRSLLFDRIEMLLPFARRQKRQDALVVMNLDRFKMINDARGQAAGDQLLKAVAERLRNMLREGDLLARLGGDEFAILLPELAAHGEDAMLRMLNIAEKVQQQVRLPIDLEGEMVRLDASLGIALFPQGEMDAAADILRRANTALHQAKSEGGGRVAFFESAMDEAARRRYQIERELRLAVSGGELRVFLQPQVDAQGRMVGAEALMRWQHPQRGLLPPGMFIPVAEESDLIIELGDWMLEAVCQLLADERFLGRPFRIAVNVSARQFRQPGFVDKVLAQLRQSGAEPSHLTLEVTESLMLYQVEQVVATMSRLAASGIHFSVDDFGTGYSSLAYLKRLPLNEIKIDKTFVQDAPEDPGDAALVEGILSLARHLHLNVVAEGVETQVQADFLNARGSVTHQGYLFGRPEPAAQVLARCFGQGERW